jgi:hypothetical protein
VWTCTWMPFTSCDLRGWFHIFTSLSLVHTSNPDLRLRLWLGFLPLPESFIHEDLHISWLPNFADSRLHNFVVLWFPCFVSSWFWTSATFWFQTSARIVHPEIGKNSSTKAEFGHYFCFLFRNLRNIQNTLRFLHITLFANMFHEFWQSDISRV